MTERCPTGRATHEPSPKGLGHSVSVPNAMSDESLVAYLDLTPDEAAKFLPKLTPELRAVYERMASVEIDLNMGVVPDGVMVCRPKGCRHG